MCRLAQTLGLIQLLPMLIACADIGSVPAGNFGWWCSTGQTGTLPSSLAVLVAEHLNRCIPVALGFECPLFVPLPDDETKLGKSRPGEGSRPWSAGAGSGVLATGLVQVAWVLKAVLDELDVPTDAFLNWQDFSNSGKGLYIWEAFVSGSGKSTSHVGDAQRAGEAFVHALPNPLAVNAINCITPVYSLVGAALLRTGWSKNVHLLAQASLVIAAAKNAA